jgi:two-component system, LytTR family, response regulator LytT
MSLRVVVVEDEAVIARRIARLTTDILGPQLAELTTLSSIKAALQTLETRSPDILLLDLNLHGEDGFLLLRQLSSASFQTIVISAHRERALEAFDCGVRDFVAKPFTRERLALALERAITPTIRGDRSVDYLGVKRGGGTEFVPVRTIRFIRGAGARSELVTSEGTFLHEKTLDRLEGILPPSFVRVHKSYIVDLTHASRLVAEEGSRYALVLKDGSVLPVGRTRVTSVRERLG